MKCNISSNMFTLEKEKFSRIIVRGFSDELDGFK